MTQGACILIVDDDSSHLSMLATLVSGWGYEVRKAEDGAEAVEAVRKTPFDAVLMDVRMAVMDGITALREIKEYNPAVPVLIMTAYSSVEAAVTAIKAGAYDYLTKPLDFDALKFTLERALDHARLETENMALKQQLPGGFKSVNMIGNCRAMRELMELIATVAPSEATVLVTGESGTGKEMIAKAIHLNSPRHNKPLVAVNCAALSETLLESELFGHEKGAFTGADKRREGRFMLANKGTIFLDEIGEIPQPIQAKLLRAIQEREIQRVGGDMPLPVDVRIIAATNKNLGDEVLAGRFREDLFYRLNVISIKAPPLRERREDIPELAKHFIGIYGKRNGKELKGLTPKAMDLLLNHDWPGNVRELENAIERSVILARGEYVTERELPMNMADSGPAAKAGQTANLSGMSLEEMERQAITETLSATGGNKSEAARRLGITRATLHNKLKKYDLPGD